MAVNKNGQKSLMHSPCRAITENKENSKNRSIPPKNAEILPLKQLNTFWAKISVLPSGDTKSEFCCQKQSLF
jgi:hypothetical protein